MNSFSTHTQHTNTHTRTRTQLNCPKHEITFDRIVFWASCWKHEIQRREQKSIQGFLLAIKFRFLYSFPPRIVVVDRLDGRRSVDKLLASLISVASLVTVSQMDECENPCRWCKAATQVFPFLFIFHFFFAKRDYFGKNFFLFSLWIAGFIVAYVIVWSLDQLEQRQQRPSAARLQFNAQILLVNFVKSTWSMCVAGWRGVRRWLSCVSQYALIDDVRNVRNEYNDAEIYELRQSNLTMHNHVKLLWKVETDVHALAINDRNWKQWQITT